MFPGILGRTNHALNSAVTKAAGDKDPINALEDFVKICFRAFHINRIDVFDFHIGMVVEAGMLQGFDDTDVSIGQFDVFSYDADFRLVLVGAMILSTMSFHSFMSQGRSSMLSFLRTTLSMPCSWSRRGTS